MAMMARPRKTKNYEMMMVTHNAFLSSCTRQWCASERCIELHIVYCKNEVTGGGTALANFLFYACMSMMRRYLSNSVICPSGNPKSSLALIISLAGQIKIG